MNDKREISEEKIALIESEQDFLRYLLITRLDSIVDKIKERLREDDIKISTESVHLHREG